MLVLQHLNNKTIAKFNYRQNVRNGFDTDINTQVLFGGRLCNSDVIACFFDFRLLLLNVAKLVGIVVEY